MRLVETNKMVPMISLSPKGTKLYYENRFGSKRSFFRLMTPEAQVIDFSSNLVANAIGPHHELPIDFCRICSR